MFASILFTFVANHFLPCRPLREPLQAMKGGEPNRLMGFKCSSPTCSPESDMAAASGQLQLLDPYGCDLYTAASLSDTNDLPVVAYFRKSNASFPAATWTVVCLDSMCSDFSRQPLQVFSGIHQLHTIFHSVLRPAMMLTPRFTMVL